MAKKRRVTNAATLLPLAIGLTMNAVGPHPATSRPSATATHARTTSSKVAFKPGCKMPFQSDPVPQIDNACTIDGGSSDKAKIAESEAKNNFCIPEANQAISLDQLKMLQSKTKFSPSEDRSPLQDVATIGTTHVGEGTFVQFIGLIQDAHYSNVSNGEAVNCGIGGQATNDIHIVVVQNLDDDPCESITAEMSPHFRPALWTPDTLNGLKRPVRFHGPLFYDGSHQPCRGGKRASPARAAVWEIHPVYAVDVCKASDIASCQKPRAEWIPLEDWLGSEAEPADQ